MRKILFLSMVSLLVFFQNKSQGQTSLMPFKYYVPYKITENKKPTYYNRQIKRLKKSGALRAAVGHAFKLKTVGKKKQIKKANKFLEENFSTMVNNTKKRVEILESETTTFENEASAQKANELCSIYQEMVQLSSLSKGAGGKYTIDDYSAELEKAKRKQDEYFKSIAQLYFEEVKTVRPSASGRSAHVQLAKKLQRALRYDNREDISAEYKNILPSAMTNFGIGLVTDEINNSGISTNDIRLLLYGELDYRLKNKKNLPLTFFRLIPNNQSMQSGMSNVMVKVVVRDVNIQKNTAEPYVKKLTKSIGDENNEQVARATYTEHEKFAVVKVEGIYEIRDVKTGQVIKKNTITGSYRWSHRWATFSGDKRALKKQQKYMVTLKNENYPSRTSLIKDGCNSARSGLVAKVITEIMTYAKSVGQ